MSQKRSERRGPAVGLVARALLAALVIAASLTPASAHAMGQSGTPWIVQLRDAESGRSTLRFAQRDLGVSPTHRFRNVLNGFAARLTERQRHALLADPAVAAVVPDRLVRAAAEPAQEVQPGIRRVGALQNPERTGATLDVDIAIVDTGIQPNHPDLNVVGGYNCTDAAQSEADRKLPASWSDGASFGHGTHVAGIAAARNNGSGVEGVAAGARLWAIKVLTNSGLGYWSWVICGLEHVASMSDPADPARPRIEVVNMSLAGGGSDDGNCGRSNQDPLHQAVCRLERTGVTMVVAAGNERANAASYVPAAYDEVITASALADYDGQPGGDGAAPSGCSTASGVNAARQSDDAFATFSNFGRDVDLIAPGVCVMSTLPNGNYGRMTGTSMASPHVAGGAALFYLSERRAGRGRPTTREVRAALVETGSTSWRTGTDRDSTHEPLLDVSGFSLGADFEISSSPGVRIAEGGDAPSFDIMLARLGGFSGSVEISVVNSTLPAAATANVDESAAGLPPGAVARVTITLSSSTTPGTYDIGVRGTSTGATRSTTVRVIVEHPPNGGPWMDILGTRTDGFAIPVRIKWATAGGDYQLQRSRDGGAWKTIANTNATRKDISAWPGSRYQFRVRSGSGAWKYGTSSVLVPKYPPADVDLNGNWQRDPSFSSYGELPVYSTQAGATARLDFTGRAVAWIATEGPSRGRANVYIDGSFVRQVDLYASSSRARQIVFTHAFSSFGAHTLRIEVLGSPSSRPRVDIDALMVVAH